MVYIKHSKLSGKGTFTDSHIKKGAYITTLKGERLVTDEVEERIKKGIEHIDDPLQIGEGIYLDLDEASRTINHSCNPNSGIKGVSDLYAIADIQQGEEITYDYSTTVGIDVPKNIWSMKCNCAEPTCRKIIWNVSSIPKVQLKKYKLLGVLPDFVTRQLNY